MQRQGGVVVSLVDAAAPVFEVLVIYPQRRGGVYAGNLTLRMPTQIIPGVLNSGAVGTAFLGRSPDGSAKAVFAAITADGAVVKSTHCMRSTAWHRPRR